MQYVVWGLLLLLLILHQDYWQWDNDTLLFGFLPYSLFYHACISLAAAGVWTFAVKYCWPEGLEDPPSNKNAEERRETAATSDGSQTLPASWEGGAGK